MANSLPNPNSGPEYSPTQSRDGLIAKSTRSADLESNDQDSVAAASFMTRRIDHFTWPWFACTMSTGALAVVISQQPYTFPGLTAIGKIFFLLDIVLVVSFSIAITCRFVRNPKKLPRSLHKPTEGLFFGAFWVTLALLLNCTQAYGAPATGPWLVKALEVLFWTYAACVILVVAFQYSTLFIAERCTVSDFMPAWIFPAYPFLVIGPLAAVLIPSQPPASALRIFIAGIMFQGLGWCVSFIMYTVYVIRLMSSELPPPPARPGMFVSVGPAGYTSAALVSLGMRAQNVVPLGFLGVRDFDVGASLRIMGILAGIFLFLLSCWFFALSTIAVLTGARRMKFTLNWWAFIFPNAGLILAAIQIGDALESPSIQAITSALTIVLVVLWFFVAGSHIIAVSKRIVLWRGMDEDVETDK